MTFAGSKIWNEIPKETKMVQRLHSFMGVSKGTSNHTAGTFIMTHWCTLLAVEWGPLGDPVLCRSEYHQSSAHSHHSFNFI